MLSDWPARVGALIFTDSSLPETLHPIRDGMRLVELARSLETHGWQGPPVVVDGDRALTGSHRVAAIKVLRRDGTSAERDTTG